ncbi:acetyl-coenzyme A transporter 1 [Sebastes umbrosus]|uniref:acetyl-coenzyme A transporter 1 n=1 Tax=Sebastes umbrosus TaxID=72105 RepID=UPI00189CDAD7|nr:acetyl-coenzyme A transporter 1 [Sebastes umbrosus]XP_037632013.1 acetyl-coenzyme A transporter 1 [Sebastes umbrosus]XP_037632014.1 acetyl-coenzyme A transporter 1 [Sebastes umbrosus]XP_037632016.1 acetyl-coenzyme A transporter 1 [Sebastes umbrosus]XP_037632017.1 acetyl-coenzyme A transporter 1 [Sebastes umbrosus]XP_037632018.1 acetyl-coenzyme A transporter 1 [Sebastes umbrosus]XP_037632019.1 acetyl-coenzyme A transporter 1 [Sebastes umbrosus]XP_037632020.1 acetyl-coenzyme A transporter 1
MEHSDLNHKNGRQRKVASTMLPPENMRGVDRIEMSYSEPEVEEETEDLIRGSDSENRRYRVRPGIRGELGNVLLLLFLYVLQGIPLGLAGSIPLILQSKSVSYKDQAFFSFVFWPFSLKLLWAPLVDALYCSRFGRRKSWLVPTQYLLGLFMLYLSGTVNSVLQSEGGPKVVTLTAIFFMLAFLAATQDIAVDGWALTMLSRENVGYASTCNSVGQTAGYFLGNVLFLALESADFCNKYLRVEPKDTGIVTLSDFLFFWGIVFLVSTTLVAIMKKENGDGKGKRRVQEETQGVMETYKLLFSIIKMPTVFTFCALLLTAKIGFSAADAVTGLKLVEAGVPKEQLALLAVPMVPLQILLPVIISKYTAGPRPLDVFYKAFPFRLLIGLEYALLVWWTPSLKQEGGFPLYYYAIVLVSYALHQVALYSMYVACMAFHAKVSDPFIGGTYMTLLNTVTNLGGNWPSTLALWMVDPLTSKECQGAVAQSCGSPAEAGLCVKEGGVCVTTLDGYYVESVVCVVIGVAWWVWLGKKMKRLQDQSPAAWRCRAN